MVRCALGCLWSGLEGVLSMDPEQVVCAMFVLFFFSLTFDGIA
jgi:hypothetical protein